MRAQQIIGSFFKLAVIGACAYGELNWKALTSTQSELEKFAENACADGARNRYNLSRVSVYEVRKGNDTYVARASGTTENGKTLKITCLLDAHGGIREILIEEK